MNVITLVHGRATQLANLIAGLERSSIPPGALWVVWMNEVPTALHSERFPIHALRVDGENGALPLARARNAIRGRDEVQPWVFLDVDCIPSPTLLEGYRQALAAHPQALHLGEVRYLPPFANGVGWTAQSLHAASVAHPLAVFRSDAGQRMPHHLFWSLNFACHGEVFERIGGFDEGYLGYGAEDTDFAFRAREQGVELRSAAALAYHQYHPTYHPPLNHFAAIVANARRFRRRWCEWPMGDWLNGFAERGLIDWQDEQLDVLRQPSAAEIAACFNEARTGF